MAIVAIPPNHEANRGKLCHPGFGSSSNAKSTFAINTNDISAVRLDPGSDCPDLVQQKKVRCDPDKSNIFPTFRDDSPVHI